MAKFTNALFFIVCLSLIISNNSGYAVEQVDNTTKNPIEDTNGSSAKELLALDQVLADVEIPFGKSPEYQKAVEAMRITCEVCKNNLVAECHRNSLECACGGKTGLAKEGCMKLMVSIPENCRISQDECNSRAKNRCGLSCSSQ